MLEAAIEISVRFRFSCQTRVGVRAGPIESHMGLIILGVNDR